MGNPHVRSSCSSTPVESPAPGHLRCGDAAPIDSQSKGFHVGQFRGSIARPSHSLSTLRTADYSNGTQDSLPAAGQLYRTGIAPAGFLRKVSEIRHFFFLPPFPRLRGARLTCRCPLGANNNSCNCPVDCPGTCCGNRAPGFTTKPRCRGPEGVKSERLLVTLCPHKADPP